MKSVRFAFLALAAMLLAVGAFAQATGSIEGKITDEAKAFLPGVTVEASSPSLPAPKVVTSDAQGNFRVSGLPPAPIRSSSRWLASRPRSRPTSPWARAPW